MSSNDYSSLYKPSVILAGGLELWAESFGDRKNPALILVMGSGGQGLLWPQPFCEQLAKKGYFVIRYDHRDTGLSSSIDYAQKPYTLLDLAKDLLYIIDHYQLKKAHIAGASMGGAVAMLLAAHYPACVDHLILMMTTTDMRPAFEAYQGLTTQSKLSQPLPEVIASTKTIVSPPETLEEKINLFLDNYRLNSGGKVPIDEEMCRQIALQSFVRMKNPEGPNNHFKAIRASYELLDEAPAQIKHPTLIIHGDVDPVFPIDHAYALQNALPHAKLAIIPNLGHGLPSHQFFSPIIQEIDAFCLAS